MSVVASSCKEIVYWGEQYKVAKSGESAILQHGDTLKGFVQDLNGIEVTDVSSSETMKNLKRIASGMHVLSGFREGALLTFHDKMEEKLSGAFDAFKAISGLPSDEEAKGLQFLSEGLADVSLVMSESLKVSELVMAVGAKLGTWSAMQSSSGLMRSLRSYVDHNIQSVAQPGAQPLIDEVLKQVRNRAPMDQDSMDSSLVAKTVVSMTDMVFVDLLGQKAETLCEIVRDLAPHLKKEQRPEVEARLKLLGALRDTLIARSGVPDGHEDGKVATDECLYKLAMVAQRAGVRLNACLQESVKSIGKEDTLVGKAAAVYAELSSWIDEIKRLRKDGYRQTANTSMAALSEIAFGCDDNTL